jgi:hypothetical protein
MRKLLGPLVGGLLGLVLGVALVSAWLERGDARRAARGELGPVAGQGEGLLFFLVVPLTTLAGAALGRGLARVLTPEPRPPADSWSPPGATEVNRAITGLGPARDGDTPPPA